MSYPVLLRPIVITADNKVIKFKEGATTGTITLTEGTYFLRPAASGADSILFEIKALIDAFGGTNTYTATLTCNIDADEPTAEVSFTQTGGATFQFLWAHADTTFDPAWLGFADANTADSTGAKTSTLSPSSLWVSDAPYVDNDPVDEFESYAVRANSGLVRDGVVGGPFDVRLFSFGMVASKRTHHSYITADEDRAFSRFLARWLAGRPAELHLCDVATYPDLGDMSASTEVGSRWHVAGDTRERFAAARLDRATGLWSWALELWGYVVP